MRCKETRIKSEVVCPHCEHTEQLWPSNSVYFECRNCYHRQLLRSGTIIHSSNFQFKYWFKAIHLMTSTKKTSSALEIQPQLSHKCYHPIWGICHKIRIVIGQRVTEYTLSGIIELNKVYFSTEHDDDNIALLNCGRGSQMKRKVLVMIEGQKVENPTNHKKPKSINHLKMIVIPDLKAPTINGVSQKSIEQDTAIYTDASTSYTYFAKYFNRHNAPVIPPQKISNMLLLVHIAISNAKALLTDMYHVVKCGYLKSYLNEFCYKMNRFRTQLDPFERLLVVTTKYKSNFNHISIDRLEIYSTHLADIHKKFISHSINMNELCFENSN